MRLKDLKIGAQLRLGLGMLLALLLGVGALSLRQTDVLWRQASFLYHKSIEVRRVIGALQAEILAIRLEYRNILLEEGDQERSAASRNIAAHAAAVERLFHDLYERYPGPREDIDQARDVYARWRSLQADNWEQALAGNITAAMSVSKETGDVGMLRKELMEHISGISDLSRNKTDMFYRESEALKNMIVQMLVFMAAASLLFFLIVSWLLLQGIREPLRELGSAIDKFRQGKMNVRVEYASANEYGDLSRAFNEMAETLDAQAQINDQAAQLAGVMLRELEARAFCREMLLALLGPTGSQIGAVYLLNPERNQFECFESIGLSPAKCPFFSPAKLDGEFGMATATGRLQRITDIPEDTPFVFSSVSGTFLPREIITLPLRIGQETVAVISLASLRGYDKQAIRLLEVVLSTAAARMNGVLAFRQIQELAEKLESQNVKLMEQKQELILQADEMAQLNTELEMQKRQLEEANRIKSAFLSNMSHELRTPLNSVLALSRVLMMQAKTKLDAEEINYLEIIERNGKNLLAMINDILDLAKIEAGRMDLRPRLFSLSAIVADAVETMVPLAEEKHIEITRDIPEVLPRIESDELRVSQILQNLMSNAVKFTDQGSVTVSATSDGKKAFVRIADTGIGIAQDALDYIFDEFRQVDWSASKRHEGTGLGLALARKAARMLGGDISVQSVPGAGSTFSLMLPLAWQPGAPACEPSVSGYSSSERTMHEPGVQGGLEPDMTARTDVHAAASDDLPRILVVEDNPAAIMQVKAVLESAGYVVDQARGGQEALEYVSRTIPEGIVLDLMMPEVDGFEVLEKIRSKSNTATIPVLILTAKDLNQEDFKRLSANNIQYLVQKGDVDKESLLLKIKSMLGRKEKARAGKLESDAGEERPLARAPRPATLLIVEDNPDNMSTIKAVLQDRYRILEAANGEECLRMSAEGKPDLVLLDMALPKVDGFTVARHLKSDQVLRHVPVIALTALAMKGDREKILEAGCDDYIAKPIDPAYLLDKIYSYLKR